MSATRSPTAAPPSAARIWCTPTEIFLELPGNPSHIMSFSRNSAGLSKVLNLVYGHAEVSGRPMLSVPKHTGPGTPTQYAAAVALLRRARLI